MVSISALDTLQAQIASVLHVVPGAVGIYLFGELPAHVVAVTHGPSAARPFLVDRWARVWDPEIGLTRDERDGTLPVQRIEQAAELAAERQASIYADAPRVRTQWRQQGIVVGQEPHLAAQRP